MSLTLASVVFQHMSGLSQDRMVNDFVFDHSDNLQNPALATGIANAVRDFYNVRLPSGADIAAYLSPVIDRGANKTEVRMYDITNDLTGTPHGSPEATRFFTLDPVVGNTALPSELAVCLTMRGDYGDEPEFGTETGPGGGRLRLRARRRGRLYIGPLETQVIAGDPTTKRPLVSASFRTPITLAAKTLMDMPDLDWRVWSRVNGETYSIKECWVDDAFDVQRRRGEDPIARTTVTAA